VCNPLLFASTFVHTVVNINEYVHVKCLRALLYSAADIEVGDPITLMDSDPAITFVKVIVTFYLLLWIRLLFSFIDMG